MKTSNYKILDSKFKIEESAKRKLDTYRKSIARHFKKEGDQDVIDDIDYAIVEKFETKLKRAPKSTILKKDVEKVIKMLGSVEDITGMPEVEEQPIVQGKALYRDTRHAVLGGVCSGLAAYFGISPVMIRVVFILAIPLPLPSIIPYLLLWLVMPPTQSKADELRMYGAPVTLNSLSISQEYSKQTASNIVKGACSVLIIGLLILISFPIFLILTNDIFLFWQ